MKTLFLTIILIITPTVYSAENINNKFPLNKNPHNLLISFGNSNNERLTKLKYAMKIVGARMRVGISYKDLNTTFLPLIDALAITEDDYPDELIVKNAQKAMQLFDVTKAYWGNRISSTERDGAFVWSADQVLVPFIKNFNEIVKTINPSEEGLNIPELKKQYNNMTLDIVSAKSIETTMYQYLQAFLSR